MNCSYFPALFFAPFLLTLCEAAPSAPSPTKELPSPSSENDVKKNKVVIYSADFCSSCKRAKEFFEERHIPYKVVDIQGNKPLIDKLERVTGKRTVPQIFINGEYLGGYLALLGANLSGRLEELLAKNDSSIPNQNVLDTTAEGAHSKEKNHEIQN